ncbi:MAG: gamma-glutamyl-gamma-aminobutyrate hydrolase family protein [Solirubrobacteraceae bacterium]
MTSRPPVIGIVSALEHVKYGVWDVAAFLLSAEYVRSVQRAGGLVLMIPPDDALLNDPGQVLDRIDGLILAGGADVDPATYGADPHPATNGTVPERDRTEVALLRAAIERDMPVLGICRGMQVLNAARGGTLIQHLPDVVEHEEHRRNPGSFDNSEHDVNLDPESLAASVAGEHAHVVHSHHHQAVDELGEGLVITGRSTLDDLPEAIELPSCTFVLGVQWHPEVDHESHVVETFVSRVRELSGAATPN